MSKAKTIKDLPRIERPREKLEKYGPSKLKDAELLAVLLRTGSYGQNVLQVARKILRKFPEDKLSKTSVKELKESFGIGAVKACEIVACFELGRRFLKGKKANLVLGPQQVWQELKEIRAAKKEHLVVFYLDVRRQEIKKEIISIGSLTGNVIHPREVFESAIRCNAAQIVIAHNHPSGDPEPSEHDLQITERLLVAGEILGIDLLDHVIVTAKKWHSLAENGEI